MPESASNLKKQTYQLVLSDLFPSLPTKDVGIYLFCMCFSNYINPKINYMTNEKLVITIIAFTN